MGEVISYESYTTEPPYRFEGCKRGVYNTDIISHGAGEIGGVLDVSEFSATSIYLDQNSDMQDEIADKIAEIYGAGFEFVYYDGSEGVSAPFEFHVPNAQYRVYKKLPTVPLFCEGAAKAHFSWHYVTGGNAFDTFSADVFKKMIDKHPLKEAAEARQDFTRVNFGWWSFNNNMQKDIYEYGTSRAFAWDCPITMHGRLPILEGHPRLKDMLEVIRRWEYARKNNIISKEEKEMLKNPGCEHTLLINEKGEYELTPYYEVKDAFGKDSDISAFVFERLGRAYAVIWHKTAEATAKISLPNAKYERDLGKESLPILADGDEVIIEIDGAPYRSADISMDELRDRLISATVIKGE
jgi:hypothetical protein